MHLYIQIGLIGLVQFKLMFFVRSCQLVLDWGRPKAEAQRMGVVAGRREVSWIHTQSIHRVYQRSRRATSELLKPTLPVDTLPYIH